LEGRERPALLGCDPFDENELLKGSAVDENAPRNNF